MRRLDFNQLPRVTRERFLEASTGSANAWGAGGPILKTNEARGAVVGWIVLLVTAGIALFAIGASSYGSTYWPRQHATYLPWYVLFFGLATMSILGLVRRGMLARKLPFAPGLYLFPLDLVVARSKDLELHPIAELVSLQPVHHYRNGIYSGTVFTLRFPGKTFSMSVYGRELAEHHLNQLRGAQRAVVEALERGDVGTVSALDPFFDARVRDWAPVLDEPPGVTPAPTAAAMPAWTRFVWAVGLGAGLVLAPPAWLARNWRSDEASFARVRAYGDTYSLRGYAEGGGRHAAEVWRDLLPRAELRDAKKEDTVEAIEKFIVSHPGSVVDDDAKRALAAALHKEFLKRHTVTELRAFIAKWPSAADVPNARAAIHALYQQTVADFRAHANPDEPNAVPVIESLVAYEEAHDSPALLVRFRRRSSPSLAAADKLLAAGLLDEADDKSQKGKKGGRGAASSHFTPDEAAPREAAVVHALETGFRQVFPADVLPLELGPLVEDDPAKVAATPGKPGQKKVLPLPDVDRPTIFVDYEVSWSGSTYVGKDSGRRFVGIAVRFDVSVRNPNEKRELDFSLRVEPPEHFTVDYTKWDPNFASIMGKRKAKSAYDDDDDDAKASGPADAVVYDVMALRAFDQMSSKLKGVFFDAETAAARGGVVDKKNDGDDDNDDDDTK